MEYRRLEDGFQAGGPIRFTCTGQIPPSMYCPAGAGLSTSAEEPGSARGRASSWMRLHLRQDPPGNQLSQIAWDWRFPGCETFCFKIRTVWGRPGWVGHPPKVESEQVYRVGGNPSTSQWEMQSLWVCPILRDPAARHCQRWECQNRPWPLPETSSQGWSTRPSEVGSSKPPTTTSWI